MGLLLLISTSEIPDDSALVWRKTQLNHQLSFSKATFFRVCLRAADVSKQKYPPIQKKQKSNNFGVAETVLTWRSCFTASRADFASVILRSTSSSVVEWAMRSDPMKAARLRRTFSQLSRACTSCSSASRRFTLWYPTSVS